MGFYAMSSVKYLSKLHRIIMPSSSGPNSPKTVQSTTLLRLLDPDIRIRLEFSEDFTFMWPCNVTNFFLIKPTDALISQIYFCQKTLHVSDSSSAHHQEFSTIHSALVYVEQVWWPGRAWKLSSYLIDLYQCRMYSGKLLMMGRGTVRNL